MTRIALLLAASAAFGACRLVRKVGTDVTAAAVNALSWLDDYEVDDTLASPLEGARPW